jgi:thioredoxin reductase
VFVEVGYVTRSGFMRQDLDECGEIIADWEGKTKTPGVFVVDVFINRDAAATVMCCPLADLVRRYATV